MIVSTLQAWDVEECYWVYHMDSLTLWDSVVRVILHRISKIWYVPFTRIRKTAELLTYIRTLKMYGWELLFASWLMKTRSSEVQHLSVIMQTFYCRLQKGCLSFIWYRISCLRLGSIWMHGVCSFGRRHPPFSRCSPLDSTLWWVTSLMLQRYCNYLNTLWRKYVDNSKFLTCTCVNFSGFHLPSSV